MGNSVGRSVSSCQESSNQETSPTRSTTSSSSVPSGIDFDHGNGTNTQKSDADTMSTDDDQYYDAVPAKSVPQKTCWSANNVTNAPQITQEHDDTTKRPTLSKSPARATALKAASEAMRKRPLDDVTKKESPHQTSRKSPEISSTKKHKVQSKSSASDNAVIGEETVEYESMEDTTPMEVDTSDSYFCWRCQVELYNKNDPNGRSLYAVHVHHLLKVPTCSVCAEKLNAAYADADLEEEDAVCLACGGADETGTLFLCDGDTNCPFHNSGWCADCIAQAQGTPDKARDIAQSLQRDDAPWKCPLCNPPPCLRKLQLLVKDESDGDDDEQPQSTRTVEQALQHLFDVESEKTACLEKLEEAGTVEGIEKMRILFRKDLLSKYGEDENALEQAVEEEVSVWLKQLNDHDERLSDMAASLRDELDNCFKLDLEKVYNNYLPDVPLDPSRQDDGDESNPFAHDNDDDDEEEMEAYVKAANKVIDKRNRERRRGSQPIVTHEDTYEDVEELVDDREYMIESHATYGRGWKSTRSKPTEKAIQQALDEEDTVFRELNLKVKAVFKETEDRNEELREERETSRRGGASGSMVVRKDHVFRRTRGSVARSRAPATSVEKKQRPKERSSHQRTGKEINEVDMGMDYSDKLGARSDISNGGDIVDASSAKADDHSQTLSSDFFLCDTEIRKVKVDGDLVQSLKPHQCEGIKFIWRNCFSDFDRSRNGSEKTVGGCLLAHCMGLGKSFTAISILHTVMNSPAMRDGESNQPMLRNALLVVPLNTIQNWSQEVQKWTHRLADPLVVYNLNEIKNDSRKMHISRWHRMGGLLIVSDQTFHNLVQQGDEVSGVIKRAQILIIDEAHTMLKNSSNQVFKALQQVQTPRKILLTGTPLANNVSEYYRMMEYARPNAIGVTDEKEFERVYRNPIERGLPSDATASRVLKSYELTQQLHEKLQPFVHRKDAGVLRSELPHMQQAILLLRPTRTQSHLFNLYKRRQKGKSDGKNYNNFLRKYQDMRPIYNHPGCLLESKSVGDEGSLTWWEEDLSEGKIKTLGDVENSSKMVLLLYVLAYAETVGDKVLVFSQSLKTLNYVERILAHEDWMLHVPSLKEKFPDKRLGGMKRDVDYVRIDGDTKSGDRGDLVDKFNDSTEQSARVFLISSKAGGIGINLPTANRVVLLDTHFNPTVDMQCIFRVYRYGQEKEVFVYRFLTEGTMEEKIYARSVNKSGVALRVLDKKSYNRSFSAKELEDLQLNDTWIQCDVCDKWRLQLQEVENVSEDDYWECSMNKADAKNKSCDAPQRTQKWYEKEYFSAGKKDIGSPLKCMARESEDSAVPDELHQELVKKDKLLQILTTLSQEKRGKKKDRGGGELVSHFYFHDKMLLSDQDLNDEQETIRKMVAEEAAKRSSPARATASSGTVPSSAGRIGNAKITSPAAACAVKGSNQNTRAGDTEKNRRKASSFLSPRNGNSVANASSTGESVEKATTGMLRQTKLYVGGESNSSSKKKTVTKAAAGRRRTARKEACGNKPSRPVQNHSNKEANIRHASPIRDLASSGDFEAENESGSGPNNPNKSESPNWKTREGTNSSQDMPLSEKSSGENGRRRRKKDRPKPVPIPPGASFVDLCDSP